MLLSSMKVSFCLINGFFEEHILDYIGAWDICLKLKENGLIAKHTHQNIIRFAPPLVMTKDHLEESTDIIVRTVNNIETA